MSTKKAPHGPKNPKKMSKAAKQRPERAQHGAPQMRREAFRPRMGIIFYGAITPCKPPLPIRGER